MTTEALAPPNGNALARPAAKNTIKALFESPAIRQKMLEVIPKHLTPERLVRVALMAISRTPALGRCSSESLLDCFMKASQLGLDFGPLGSAYLVPYGNQATLIVGYRGFIDLARRSGQIASIQAQVVRQGDDFEFEYGLEMKFRHRPKAATTSPILYAWALAQFKEEGVYQLDVMTKDEIDSVRKRSRASGSGPWVTDYAEMAKKTVVRRLAKYLPLSPEMMDLIETSDKGEFGDTFIDTQAIEVAQEQKDERRKSRASQLAEDLEKPAAAPVVDDDAQAAEIAEGIESGGQPAPEGAAATEAQQEASAPSTVEAGGPTASAASNPRSPEEIAEEYVANTKPSELLPELKAAGVGDANVKARLDKAREAAGVPGVLVSDLSDEQIKAVAYHWHVAKLRKHGEQAAPRRPRAK